jgi:hypothetical protein
LIVVVSCSVSRILCILRRNRCLPLHVFSCCCLLVLCTFCSSFYLWVVLPLLEWLAPDSPMLDFSISMTFFVESQSCL